MKKINLFLAIIILLLTSCEKRDKDELNPDPYKGLKGWRKYDKLIDIIFETGFTMSLEEVYPVNKRLDGYSARELVNDKSKNVFAYNQSIINARNLTVEKGEDWKISKEIRDTTIYELSQGKYEPGRYIKNISKHNEIIIKKSEKTEKLVVQFENGPSTEYSWESLHGNLTVKNSNLNLSVFDFDGKQLSVITNYQVFVNTQPNRPLTSNQVKLEIKKGNYEIVMVKNNLTAYKIGENLYLPSYGDSYVYYGSTSANNLVDKLISSAYIFVFKLSEPYSIF